MVNYGKTFHPVWVEDGYFNEFVGWTMTAYHDGYEYSTFFSNTEFNEKQVKESCRVANHALERGDYKILHTWEGRRTVYGGPRSDEWEQEQLNLEEFHKYD